MGGPPKHVASDEEVSNHSKKEEEREKRESLHDEKWHRINTKPCRERVGRVRGVVKKRVGGMRGMV